MEGLGFTWFDGLSNVVRKKRSQTSHRARPDLLPVFRGHGLFPSLSTPSSDDVMEGLGFTWFDGLSNVVRKKRSQRSQTSRRARPDLLPVFRGHGLFPSLSTPSSEDATKAPSDENAGYVTNLKRKGFNLNHCERNSEGLILGQLAVTHNGSGNEKRVQRVKLKFSGVTHTIQTKSTSSGASRKKQQTNSDNNPSTDKRSVLQGLPWKDFSKGGFGLGKEETVMGRISRKNMPGKEGDMFELVRKSKRVPRRRVLDREFSDDDFEDDKIRYLEKPKTPKASNMENAASSSSSRKDGKKKSRFDRVHEDTDYEDEEELESDVELEDKKKQKQRKQSIDVLMDSLREITLTRRQWALLSSNDASASGASLIEFPNGLPPAPPRKQKEKLSEMELQLKKAEAAQKRRMQVEKAARKSEAEAIRKILGRESSRKKREEKMKKRQEKLAQEKAANELAPNTIRYVMGPTGTIVTFPEEMGLPSILNSKPISYPPPREKCAGPSCTNPYKYRDSKYKLPLCSLQCYKAVHEKMAAETASASTS